MNLHFPEDCRLHRYSVKAEHWFLRTPSAKSKSALRQGIVFLCLCPREVLHICFSFCKVFASEACNNQAEPTEVDTCKGDWVKAFSDRFPRFTASYERAEMYVSIGSFF